MAEFTFEELDMSGAFLIEYAHYGDNRGGFSKFFEKNEYFRAGINFNLIEAFSSISMKNVLRGLHFQLANPQAKLVTVQHGAVWDVIVDLRIGSKTYKKWQGFELSADNHRGLYMPRGFAHGFVSLEDYTIMLYQCEGEYDSETDSGIKADDNDIGIEWPIELDDAIRSERDRMLPSFSEYKLNPMRI